MNLATLICLIYFQIVSSVFLVFFIWQHTQLLVVQIAVWYFDSINREAWELEERSVVFC